MLKLYGNYKSGNVYKVSLAMHQLGLEYQEVQIGLGPGTESESAAFLALNPLGQIPVLETGEGRFIWQSNAILWYLAQGSSLLPEDRFEQAQVMQWMCFEQYELEPNLAWARWICYLMNQAEERAEDLAKYHAAGYRALDTMEQKLSASDFIALPGYNLADLALYAYTHTCDQGNFSLEDYPAIRAWLERIERIEGYFPISEQFTQFDYR